MTHIITRACCNDAACVPVCPVNCIHPTPDEPDYGTAEMLYIDPNGCVDCGACVDVCPVGAITADYDLPDEFALFETINARYFASPERSDYEQTPRPVEKRTWDPAPEGVLRVAIVGSGPAACYAAEELMSQRGLKVEVDMFERLPVPWGLVRFGVAPDHQDTKAASGSFARTMRRPGFRLFLNTEVGKDIELEDLRQRYHAVVCAVGAMGDRALDIPGEELPGSHSATEFVAWYNGHPDFADRQFDLSRERAVIIGNGNVALDVARILVSDSERLAKTDIADHALLALQESKVREVFVVGRRGPLEAAFTTKELLGIAEVPGVDLVIPESDLQLDPASVELAGDPASSVTLYKTKLMEELRTAGSLAERRITLRFLASPVEIRGEEHVESLLLEHNRMERDGDRMIARGTGETEEIDAGLVFRSVGYRGRSVEGLPFDEVRGVIPHVRGRVVDPATEEPVSGVYVTGWIKRGPSGVIGSNKNCARESVRELLDDYAAARLPVPLRSAEALTDELPYHLDLAGWRLIDDYEKAEGRAHKRPRVKLIDVTAMLDVARTP